MVLRGLSVSPSLTELFTGCRVAWVVVWGQGSKGVPDAQVVTPGTQAKGVKEGERAEARDGIGVVPLRPEPSSRAPQK